MEKQAAPRQSRGTLALTGVASAFCVLSICSLLSGCGGASTSKTQQPFVPSGPTVYGIQQPIGTATQMGETSGFGSTDFMTGYITGAVASNAKPPIGIASAQGNNGTIPLGFFAGGQYIDNSFGAAAPPGGQVIFAVDISNGNDSKGNLIPINPASVVLSNIPAGQPDLPAADAGINFNQPLHFQFPVTGGKVPVGPFSNASYTTNAFALPFNTTGLHGARVTVSDKAGNASFTDFYSLVLANADSAVLVQIVDASSNPVQGATVSITNALAGVTAYDPPGGQPTESVTDKQGIAIVFAAPGSQTITASNGVLNGNDTQTLVGGQVFNSSGGKPYSITIQ